MAFKISDEAKVQMPMKTVASLITLVAIGTWAYFGINEKLNQHSTKLELFEKDLIENTEFRIKYPRGELGQSSGEAELFMLVEHMSGLLEDLDHCLSNCSLVFTSTSAEQPIISSKRLIIAVDAGDTTLLGTATAGAASVTTDTILEWWARYCDALDVNFEMEQIDLDAGTD